MLLLNIFEPLFLLLAVTAVGTLITAAGFAIGGKSTRAARIVRRLGIGAGLYFAVVVLVSIFNPQRVYQIGDTQCFDDWCIQVVGAQWTGMPKAGGYEVRLRLSNRAQRVPMGEKGTVVYLIDGQGRRYDPLPDPNVVAFDTILRPGESVDATRRFDLSPGTPNVGLIYTHEGGFPIEWLIITEGGWFQKRPVVRLS
jgi:hypothetical protein